jgi:Domain of Unknown Function (DUF350)
VSCSAVLHLFTVHEQGEINRKHVSGFCRARRIDGLELGSAGAKLLELLVHFLSFNFRRLLHELEAFVFHLGDVRRDLEARFVRKRGLHVDLSRVGDRRHVDRRERFFLERLGQRLVHDRVRDVVLNLRSIKVLEDIARRFAGPKALHVRLLRECRVRLLHLRFDGVGRHFDLELHQNGRYSLNSDLHCVLRLQKFGRLAGGGRHDTFPEHPAQGRLKYKSGMPELPLLRASAISLTMHLFFGVITLFIGAVAIKIIDKVLLKKIDLEEEIARGNLAAAVLFASLWIALAMILTHE